MIFDTHSHYDSEEFDPDRDEILTGMPQQGVTCIVNAGASWQGVEETVKLTRHYPFLYGAVGIHPDEVGVLNEDKIASLEAYCKLEKIVAVGEIGLDYYWDKESRQLQKEWFIKQLELAKRVNLPVNIHSREAAQDTFEIMKEIHHGATGGVIHCYSGSVEMAKEYLKMGYYFGIGGVLTFKNSRILKEVVASLPIESMVTETDCPYLAPVPFRGKRNDSSKITYVIREIARIKGMDPEEAEEILFQNALRLYHLEALVKTNKI